MLDLPVHLEAIKERRHFVINSRTASLHNKIILRETPALSDLLNPHLTNRVSHHYHLGQSTFIFRGVRSDF